MKVPAFVAAGMANPTEASARYRAQILANRIAHRYRKAQGIPYGLRGRLLALCTCYSSPSVHATTIAELARRLRKLRKDFRSLFV